MSGRKEKAQETVSLGSIVCEVQERHTEGLNVIKVFLIA